MFTDKSEPLFPPLGLGLGCPPTQNAPPQGSHPALPCPCPLLRLNPQSPQPKPRNPPGEAWVSVQPDWVWSGWSWLFHVFKVGSAHPFTSVPSTLAPPPFPFFLTLLFFLSSSLSISCLGELPCWRALEPGLTKRVDYSKYMSFYSDHRKIEDVVKGLLLKKGTKLSRLRNTAPVLQILFPSLEEDGKQPSSAYRTRMAPLQNGVRKGQVEKLAYESGCKVSK